MAARASAAAVPAVYELVIVRVLDAPRERVFKAWTERDRAAQWWGPQGFATIACEMDVRPGGVWLRAMRSPEGNLFRKRGVYREIVEPERLVFTYADEDAEGNLGHETVVTVTFADIGGRTELTLHQAVFATAASRAAHEGGWASCLNRFAGHLTGEDRR